ncbi:MAG: Response regulator receiver domain [Bacteroidetes bacterium HLUCCA01]|nr:MAG: Response regulator receiver domain [Bacteroidetes bacterium HLUCCA01]
MLPNLFTIPWLRLPAGGAVLRSVGGVGLRAALLLVLALMSVRASVAAERPVAAAQSAQDRVETGHLTVIPVLSEQPIAAAQSAQDRVETGHLTVIPMLSEQPVAAAQSAQTGPLAGREPADRAAATELPNRPVVTDLTGITNRFGNMLLYIADGWMVTPSAPDSIVHGPSLPDGVAVHSLHADSLATVLGPVRYGWAELVFTVDPRTAQDPWVMRGRGYGASRMWLNGRQVFQHGTPSPYPAMEIPGRYHSIRTGPAQLEAGANYLLVEFSHHKVPEWLHAVRTDGLNYHLALLAEPVNQASLEDFYRKRIFSMGAVSLVLFLLALIHGYLSVKSVHRYHYYAFWTNLLLLLHAVLQMGDALFGWSGAMVAVILLSHPVLFLLVIYTMIHVTGSYYQLVLPDRLLRGVLYGSIVLVVFASLWYSPLINYVLPIVSGLTLVYAFYLLRMALKTFPVYRIALVFSGFVMMLAGAFVYAVLYIQLFPQSHMLYFLAILLVYVGVPVSFTLSIALNFVDIFEQMEQKVLDRTRELKEKEAFKTRFFLNVSHELRTPTTILDGLLQKAARGSEPNAGVHIPPEDASLVLRNVQRLSALVQQILQLSGSDQGELSLNRKHYRLDEIIRSVLDINQSFIGLRHQQVDFRSGTPHTLVFADGEKVHTILSNVLLNASKYGPERSRIHVETRINEQEERVEVDVTDEGEGVAAADREIIFERFHRLQRPDKPYVEGLGIGLELSRSLARLHDGDLVVADSPGGGACFRFTLPLDAGLTVHRVREWGESPSRTVAGAAATVGSTGAGESPSTAVSLRLLLVEDNPDMNAYLSGLLNEVGTVHTTRNGVEALDFLRRSAVDMVVTDLMMPEMSGGELIAHMAADPGLSTLPVVVVSAKSDVDERLHLLRVGIVDYITKPFDPEELRLKIDNLLRFYHRRASYRVEVAADAVPGEVSLSDRVKNFVLEHISDPDLTATLLADAFAMSERNFYRKIERDSGMTPAAFIREVRLQYAARLAEGGADIRMNELATRVGYRSVQTFRRNYVERFGAAPGV